MATRTITLARDSIALAIGGSDPSGGAGIQADLKAFQQNGVYGMTVLTMVTVQNTVGVHRIELLDVGLIEQQLDCVLNDIPPLAIKTGALGNADAIAAIAGKLEGYGGDLIIDPVLVSKHGDLLADDTAVSAYRDYLLPQATLATPNALELQRLIGRDVDGLDEMVQAAAELRELGPSAVLVKAGIIDGSRVHVLADEEKVATIETQNHPTNQTHGAGCSLAATITARMTLTTDGNGKVPQVESAIQFAIMAVNHAISIAPGFGKGVGPIESRILHDGLPDDPA
ncbi:Hydroxymethylpyrimidine/phosphomethylpyrimidine kinase [Rubripirellula amarantea]|uniref:hydroxymethylpyrimidine kinase n=1 Tax=Rubripirellula amarantea TaxID=2527999 RepID=A0A5C5WBQ0_9BACT|nr:bifunctional hydroxymethylpyrimidine kinase/phosphomethylpyrimidine kinase [Rubripirellula amarantea]TWT48064.1 Hydroxymethylpyrimidine/phosphomethylpyrimidine kinase [Rubripirellula amarantea]